jgi:LuxR family maltose regulon positive regulatory protein
MTYPLLLTKFHIPSVRSSLVKRPRLIEQLNQAMECKLILISATAGFGKTTLLSEWLRQVTKQVSWLSLDESDNELERFFSYFVTALQQPYGKIGESTLSMLRSTEPASKESFLIPLINEIANLQKECVLVLDDYHLIRARPIHEALTFLLEHLPPNFTLAIASRIDPPLPLARMRGRAQLTELRVADLRFTVKETAAFINQSMKLALSSEQVEAIFAKTEGWIAGLQLAALSMQDASDIPTFIESLKGSQRYILDYLLEEVLERQPKPIQSFLLRTSILEQMCGSLSEAVLGEDSLVDGTEVLEQLEQCNLFVIPLDNQRKWYRYHHLFGELLRHHLNRKESHRVSEYHRRAAKWYEQHGLIAEAIGQAIAAQDFQRAADLIEPEVQSNNPRIESAAMMLAWLEAMPPKLVWRSPWLSLSYTWALFSSSQFEAAAVAVQNIECLLKGQEPNSPSLESQMLWGLVTAFKGMQARQRGEVSESIALFEQALQQLPQEVSWLRATIVLNLGVTYFTADNFELAKPVLVEATKIGQSKGIADPAIAGLYLQAQFLALRGRMDEALRLCQQGVELARERGWDATYAGVLVQVATGEFLREQNQLEAAVQYLTEGISRGNQTRQPGVMMGYVTLARVRLATGDTQGARDAIRAAEQCQTWLWPTILSVPACKARFYLAQENLAQAIAWVEDSGLGVDDELRYSFTDRHPCGSELDYLTLARVLIARGKSDNASFAYLDNAMRLLVRLHDFAEFGGRKARVMEVLMLQALVWHARGEFEQALSVLGKALSIPHTGDYIRLFVDEGKPMAQLLRLGASQGIQPLYANRLLAAFGSVKAEASAPIGSLIEPLSDRELEVLRYLASGFSNKAIADQLFVSLATAKWHARNIYGKLNASNRTMAVARARELGILE